MVIQKIINRYNQYNIYEYKSILGNISYDNHEDLNINELKQVIVKLKLNIINKK
jgi:hypothetical protein